MAGVFSRRTCIGAAAGVAVATVSWLLWKMQDARSVALATVTVAGVPTVADADEVRTFAVTVNNKPGGTYTISTAVAADGTETITVAAAVKVKVALRTYTYELNSTEVWKNGKLVSVDAKSNDDGKRKAVTAGAGADGLTVTVNNEARKIGADVVTATGVRPPTADKVRDTVLFDAEDGSETAVRVEPLGACRVTLNGQVIDGTRFRVTGKDVAAEWWFDKNGRVIRQEMKWDGHKVILELTGVK
jgi:hypothetical protein